jgi:ABC-type multidrug transport system ATPase subunit
MRADRIVVMKDGSIIEQGSHDDLLRLKGKYYDLWANQIQLLNPDDKSDNKLNDKADDKADGKPDDKAAISRSNSPHKDKEDVASSRPRSKSPQKDKAGIVNDLDQERNQVELLKLAEFGKSHDEASHTGDDRSQTSKVSTGIAVSKKR